MKKKQPEPGEPDPNRFSVDAAGIEPMRLVKTTGGSTEEERDNAAHAEALRQAFK